MCAVPGELQNGTVYVHRDLKALDGIDGAGVIYMI